MTVRVTLTCQLNASLYNQLIPFLEENLPNVRGFDGNQRVDVLFDEHKQTMLLDEDWASVKHHQAYIGFIQENGILDQLGAFFTRHQNPVLSS